MSTQNRFHPDPTEPPEVDRVEAASSSSRLEETKMRRNPRFSLFDSAGLVVVIAWLVSLCLLWAHQSGPRASSRLSVTPQEIIAGFRVGEEWHGIYHRGQKVGFMRLVKERRAAGYHFDYWVVLRLSLLGREQRIEIRLDTTTDDQFTLTGFNGRLETSDSLFGIRGTARALAEPAGQYLVEYTLDLGTTHQEGQLPLETRPALPFDLPRALLVRDPEPGDRFETSYFDILGQREQTIVVEYRGTQDLVVMGELVRAHRLVQHMGQQQLTAWVNDIGEVLREELPLGLTGTRESRAEAMYGVLRPSEREGSDEVDLIEAASVALVGSSPDLTTPSEISWQMTGFDPHRFDLEGGRQTVRIDDGAISLSIRAETELPWVGLSDLVIPEEVDRYLDDEVLIQSDAAEILDLSRQIVGRRTRVEEIVRAINEWVHNHLEQQMVVGIPSALEVLESRRGDCNEHAVLATALLRATGIPARPAVGLAFLEGRFYYHAWVEYWLDGWRTADPTWGQVPADLGHIRFVAGGLERQVSLIELFGRITVEYEP